MFIWFLYKTLIQVQRWIRTRAPNGPCALVAADLLLDGQVGEKGVDLGLAHSGGMTDVVEEDAATDPLAVGLLGAAGVVARAQGLPKLFEQLRLGRTGCGALDDAV